MSNESFKIGDLVITQKAIYFSEYDGTPAIIVGALAGRTAVNMNSMKEEWCPATYEVRLLCSDEIVTVKPHQIRKPYNPDMTIGKSVKIDNQSSENVTI
jgi:hypothetical protein